MEIKLALANYPITQHPSLEAWQQHVTAWVEEACQQGAQVLVFPEYGSMELTSLVSEQEDLKLQLELLQDLLPAFIQTFENLALSYNCTLIAPSFPVFENGRYFNRCYVISNGNTSFQDKHFMTRFEDETWGIEMSPHPLRLFDTKHGKFGVQLCFDIEFPIGGQLLAQAGASYIVVPSCTETLKGATRVHIGARARAMEQQCFVGVSQTTGHALWSPAVDINYGYTACYATPDLHFQDEGIQALGKHQEVGWLFHTVDLNLVQDIRQNGQVLNFKHAQRQNISLTDVALEICSLH